MCLICVEFEKERLSISEARRNLGEMAFGLGDHAVEVEEMIYRKEIESLAQSYLDDEWDDSLFEYEIWHGHGD